MSEALVTFKTDLWYTQPSGEGKIVFTAIFGLWLYYNHAHYITNSGWIQVTNEFYRIYIYKTHKSGRNSDFPVAGRILQSIGISLNLTRI